MSGIKMEDPQEKCKLQVNLLFLSQRMKIKSLATRSFNMLPVLSSHFWQQAVYHPSANFDTVIWTKIWADLNSVSRTDCLIFYQSLGKNIFLCTKRTVFEKREKKCF